MSAIEQAKKLRADETRHFNCAQAVLVAYADKMNIDPEQAFNMGAHFGAGMRHGGTCGACTGALMVMGMMGMDEKQSGQFVREFRAQHEAMDCATLLSNSAKKKIPRKIHCDGLVFDAVNLLDQIMQQSQPSVSDEQA